MKSHRKQTMEMKPLRKVKPFTLQQLPVMSRGEMSWKSVSTSNTRSEKATLFVLMIPGLEADIAFPVITLILTTPLSGY